MYSRMYWKYTSQGIRQWVRHVFDDMPDNVFDNVLGYALEHAFDDAVDSVFENALAHVLGNIFVNVIYNTIVIY